MKRLLIYLLMLTSIIFVAGCKNDKVQEVESGEVHKITIAKSSHMFLTPQAAHKKDKDPIRKISANSTVQLLGRETHLSQNYYNVKMSNGDIGWIDSDVVRPGKNTWITDYVIWSKAIYPEPDNDFILHVNEEKSMKERLVDLSDNKNDFLKVTRQGNKKVKRTDLSGAPRYEHWTKVMLEDGTVGWTLSKWLDVAGVPPVKKASKKKLLYLIEDLRKKAEGKDEEWIEKKFGVPGARVSHYQMTEKKAVFINKIDIFDGKKCFRSVRFDLENDKIVKVMPTGFRDFRWTAWLPFSKMMRGAAWGNTVRNLPNPFDMLMFLSEENLSSKLPKIIAKPIYFVSQILLWIIMIILALGPVFLTTILVTGLSMNPNIETNLLMVMQGVLGVVGGHFWYLFNIYHSPLFYGTGALPFVFGPLLGTIIISLMIKNLEYKRCPRCNFWSGFGLGTVWLGSVTTKKKTTTDTFDANGRHLDTDIHEESETVSTYEDKRGCKRCGYSWSITRTQRG